MKPCCTPTVDGLWTKHKATVIDIQPEPLQHERIPVAPISWKRTRPRNAAWTQDLAGNRRCATEPGNAAETGEGRLRRAAPVP